MKNLELRWVSGEVPTITDYRGGREELGWHAQVGGQVRQAGDAWRTGTIISGSFWLHWYSR